ncbi:MAG: beta-galactosidase trimerization domain-containing protein, partial [Spirochaetaceae bacterium]|nr:beta-galactosidase trimerization domain-containing protein [Spirochaetaceae bacterium]
RARALRDNAKSIRGSFSAFASAPFESEACLVYSKDDARVICEQPLSEALDWKPVEWARAGYDRELAKWFAPFVAFNVNADVKSAESVDLDKYGAVSLPLYQMADPDFVERVDAWVRKGGHLILGYRAGARDMRNWNIREPLPGLFEEMAGIRIPRFAALGSREIGIRVGAFPAKGGVWADLIEPVAARTIAEWSDGRVFYSGLPCATANAHGRGTVWYIGTSPDARGTFLLYRKILKEAGLEPRFRGVGIEVVERRTSDGGRVKVVLNHTERRRRVMGRRIEPYGWAVLE